MTRTLIALTTALIVSTAAAQDEKQPAPDAKSAERAAVTAATAGSPLDFTLPNIDGAATPLSKYKGKVVLIVNVASKCGMTPQYEQLQALHARYHGRGLSVLGFPANNFMGQEPGDNAQIKEFCTGKYHIEFDMFGKISVKGDDCAELYRFLTSKEKNPQFGGDIEWNFTKFLIGRDGKVIGRFGPRVKPDAPPVIEAIEKALGATP